MTPVPPLRLTAAIFLSACIFFTVAKAQTVEEFTSPPTPDSVIIDVHDEIQRRLESKRDILLSTVHDFECYHCIAKSEFCPGEIGGGPDWFPRIERQNFSLPDGGDFEFIEISAIQAAPFRDRLMNLGQNIYEAQFDRACTGGKCCFGNSSTTENRGKASIDGNITFEILSLSYGEPRVGTIPLEPISQSIKYTNCASSVQNLSQTITITRTLYDTISFSRSITNGTSLTLGLNAGFAYQGMEFGMSFSQTQSRSITVTNGNSHTTGTTISRSITLPINAPPGGITTVSAVGSIWEGYIDFQAKILASASLAPNQEGLSSISQVLSREERTFDITGTIALQSMSTINGEASDEQLQGDCPGTKIEYSN